MPQPTPYDVSSDFTDYATANPASPFQPAALDAELENIEQTLDETLANLALIQRDDGAVRNDVVHWDALNVQVRTLIAATWIPRGPWLTGTAYAVGDVVEEVNVSYVCAVAHTAGVFADDRTAGYWVVLGQDLILSLFGALFMQSADEAAALTLLGISPFVQTLLPAVDEAAALTLLGVSAFSQTLLPAVDLEAAQAILGIPASVSTFMETVLDDVNGGAALGTLIGHHSTSDVTSTTQVDFITAGAGTPFTIYITGTGAGNLIYTAAAPDPVRRALMTLVNVGALDILLQAVSYTLPQAVDLVIPPGGAATFIYDVTPAKWRLIGRSMAKQTTFTRIIATGTYTPPPGLAWAKVTVKGGGGGGGGGNSTGYGGGGGAGEEAEGRFTKAQIGASIAATIGAAGASVPLNTAAVGGTGGTTSFGALITAAGGLGGNHGAAAGAGGAGGTGGAGGYRRRKGAAGMPGATGAGDNLQSAGGGVGGGTFISAGQANSGGGGGPGGVSWASGAGGSGEILVEEHYD